MTTMNNKIPSRKISEMSVIELIERDIERAAISYKKSDDGRWASAYFAAKVVGRKPIEIGATIRLAKRMGRSTDTVEGLAHAYRLYSEFRADPKYHEVIRSIRKLPYVYYSYFRSLYKARNNYSLTLEQVFDILVDIVQAEGDVSQEKLDQFIQDKFGDTRTWEYYGARAMKEIHKTLQAPDLPQHVKDALLPAYEILGDSS